MGSHADEQVVEREQSLTVVQFGFGHCDRGHAPRAGQGLAGGGGGGGHIEGEENPVNVRGVGVHGDDRLPIQVFGGVHDEAVNPDGDDEVGGGKEEVGQETALDGLDFGEGFEGVMQGFDGGVVGVMFAFVKGKSVAGLTMLFRALVDIKPGLRLRIEPFDQPFEASFAGNEDDFFVHMGSLSFEFELSSNSNSNLKLNSSIGGLTTSPTNPAKCSTSRSCPRFGRFPGWLWRPSGGDRRSGWRGR